MFAESSTHIAHRYWTLCAPHTPLLRGRTAVPFFIAYYVHCVLASSVLDVASVVACFYGGSLFAFYSIV